MADLRRHEGFNIHRQGLDMDMVSIRPVKIVAPAKTTKKKAARKSERPVPKPVREAIEWGNYGSGYSACASHGCLCHRQG